MFSGGIFPAINLFHMGDDIMKKVNRKRFSNRKGRTREVSVKPSVVQTHVIAVSIEELVQGLLVIHNNVLLLNEKIDKLKEVN
jgi:hypothetical protein